MKSNRDEGSEWNVTELNGSEWKAKELKEINGM